MTVEEEEIAHKMEMNEVEVETSEAGLMEEALRGEEMHTTPVPPLTPRRSQKLEQMTQVTIDEADVPIYVFVSTLFFVI